MFGLPYAMGISSMDSNEGEQDEDEDTDTSETNNWQAYAYQFIHIATFHHTNVVTLSMYVHARHTPRKKLFNKGTAALSTFVICDKYKNSVLTLRTFSY